MEQLKNKITEDYDSWYFCPLCMTIHEFSVSCYESLDKKFTQSLMLEFKEINEKEEKMNRVKILSKSQMRFSPATLGGAK